jgi:hypothetical protein
MNRIGYLQACRRKMLFNKSINSRTLKKLFDKTDFEAIVSTGYEAELLLREQYNELNLLKSKATQLRGNFLTELAESKAAAGDGNAESILRQLMIREEQRSVARAVKRVLSRSRCGVTAIEALNPQGEWTIFTDKSTIEHNCIQDNIARFTQASHLPIMNAVSIQSIGWFADTCTAKNILQGSNSEREIQHLDASIQRLIPYLYRPSPVKDVDCKISTAQYIHEWSRGREFTATGLSQIHFGHFKASCREEQLVELDRWMAEVSLCSGYALNRWKKGIDVMIPKKNNSLRAEQLRTIVLMEADFNFLNKLAGKRIMANAEQSGSIADEQFGSRKSKSAINHAINKQLALDIMRQQKKKFTLVILDAKGCYDRIAPPIASISLKRQGTPSSYVMMLFSTIREMKHFIRTAYGDSRDFYHQQDVPFHGILQGNGAGPTIWAMVSSPLLDRMREKGHGIKIESSEGTITIPAFAFVDDTDLVQDNEGDEGIESTQHAVSEWEDALRATGGLLVPHKCKFFVVAHEWANDKWKIVDTVQSQVELRILDDEGRSHPIQQLTATSSELALGIMFSPSGNMTAEMKYLQDKATSWADKVRSGQLSHREAWYCLNATVLRAIEYALPATTLTFRQLNSVMQPILNIGLPRSGICRKTSRSLVFAPVKYQGFGIRHPFIGQGIYKIRSLFDTRQQLSQKLIDVSWSHTMVESGLGSQFLQKDILWFQDLITEGWVKSLWEFVSTYEITVLRADNVAVSQLRHLDDCYLMEAVAARGPDIVKSDRCIFNSCRLYLQVSLISDISTANGAAIQHHIWKGIRHVEGRGWWPKQPRPSERAWKIWRRILKHTLTTDDNGRYLTKLPKTNPTDDWRWFLEKDTNCLYEKSNEGWKEYHVRLGHRNTRNQWYGNPSPCDTPNSNQLLAVTTYPRGDGVAVDGRGSDIIVPCTVTVRWQDFIEHVIVGDEEAFTQAMITNQTILIVSDGSVKDNFAAAAWILTTDKLYSSGTYITGRAKIPGTYTDSHRAECFGIYGGITLLLSWICKCNLASPDVHVSFACDNKSALRYSFDLLNTNVGAETPDFDILQTTRRLISSSGIRPTWRHVKGHQTGSDLDIWARLNNAADVLAGRARDDVTLIQPPPLVLIGEEKWQIIVNGNKITKAMSLNLFDYCTTPQVKDVFHRYNRVKHEGFELVDWNALEQAMNNSTIRQRHWISKRVARDCGCNYIRFKRRARADDGCPFCGECETVLHVLKCPSAEPTRLWEESALMDLDKWMRDNGTDPCITKALIIGLRNWRNDSELSTDVNFLIDEQEKIGWDSVLEGCLGSHWTIAQDRYFRAKNSRRSGNRWMIELIRRIWKIPWDLWQLRNQKEHLKDHENMVDSLRVEVQEQIEQGHGEVQVLVNLFRVSEIERVTSFRDVQYVRAWLRNVRAGRRRDLLRRGTRGEMDQMRSVMRAFLQNNNHKR